MAMANARTRPLRVAFLTNSQFQAEDKASGGKLRKRALQKIMNEIRYPVYESSNHPDAVFYIRRTAGSTGWSLVKKERKV